MFVLYKYLIDEDQVKIQLVKSFESKKIAVKYTERMYLDESSGSDSESDCSGCSGCESGSDCDSINVVCKRAVFKEFGKGECWYVIEKI